MKAEHRKELETNLLADRMGRIMQRMRGRPRRRVVVIVVLVLAILFGSWLVYRMRIGKTTATIQRWYELEYGDVIALRGQPGNAGKAARLSLAHFMVWNGGVRGLAHPNSAGERFFNGSSPLKSLESAYKNYQSLANECKGETDWLPEIQYNLAVIAETKYAQTGGNFGPIIENYKNVASTYPKSDFGKLAKDWADKLEKNPDDAKAFYAEMRARFNLTPPPSLNDLPPPVDDPAPK